MSSELHIKIYISMPVTKLGILLNDRSYSHGTGMGTSSICSEFFTFITLKLSFVLLCAPLIVWSAKLRMFEDMEKYFMTGYKKPRVNTLMTPPCRPGLSNTPTKPAKEWPHSNENPRYYIKLDQRVRLQSRSFEECRVTLRYHYSQVHSGPE